MKLTNALAVFQGHIFLEIDYRVCEVAQKCFNSSYTQDQKFSTGQRLNFQGGTISFKAPDMLFGRGSLFFEENTHLSKYSNIFYVLSDLIPDYIYKYFLFHLIFLSNLKNTVLYYPQGKEPSFIVATTCESAVRDKLTKETHFIAKPSEFLKHVHPYEHVECAFFNKTTSTP